MSNLTNIQIKKEDLKRLYFDKGLSFASISKKYDCSVPTIQKIFQSYGFEPRKLKVDIPPKEELEDLYYNKKMTQQEIADHYNCGRGVIKRWFKKYDIKNKRIVKIPPKKELENLYYKENLTQKELADYYHTSMFTISKWFKDYDIKRKVYTIEKPSKKELTEFYQDKNFTKLAEHYSCSVDTVRKWFKEYGIEKKKNRSHQSPNYTTRQLIPPREELEDLYYNQKLLRKDIAEKYKCSPSQITKWFKHYGIDCEATPFDCYLKPVKEKPSKKELVDLYTNKKMSYSDLMDYYNCSYKTVANWIKSYGIKTRQSIKIKKPPKKELEKLYYKDLLTFVDIGKKYNVSNVTVRKWFKEYGIEKRTHNENQKIKSNRKTAPSKTILENAYKTRNLPEMCEYFDVSIHVMKRWLRKHDIEIVNKRVIERPSKEELEKLYIDEKWSQSDIANKYNCSTNVIRKWMRFYGIETRNYPTKRTLEKAKTTKMNFYNNEYYPYGDDDFYKQFEHLLTSKPELEIKEFLENESGYKWNKTRKILDNGLEIDMYCEELKLAVEYCGIFWHSEYKGKTRKYHYDKMIGCNEKGIRLITIFSDEWDYRKEQVKGFLKSIVSKNQKIIYARKCKFVELEKPFVMGFCENYHIQGRPTQYLKSFGLVYNNELVGVIIYSRHHRQNVNKNVIILNRLCFKDGYTVIGGSSKLFKNSLSLLDCEYIVTWSDNRWSMGKVYEKMGFKLDRDLPVDYSYINIKKSSSKRLSKQSMQKKKIGCPDNMTEYEYTKSLGFSRIWDCGKKRWVYELKPK